VQYLQVSHFVIFQWDTYLLVSRADEQFVKLHGKRKAFHKGGNSSCHMHIRQHFDLYKEKCTKEDIPINHWVIPRDIWNVMDVRGVKARDPS